MLMIAADKRWGLLTDKVIQQKYKIQTTRGGPPRFGLRGVSDIRLGRRLSSSSISVHYLSDEDGPSGPEAAQPSPVCQPASLPAADSCTPSHLSGRVWRQSRQAALEILTRRAAGEEPSLWWGDEPHTSSPSSKDDPGRPGAMGQASRLWMAQCFRTDSIPRYTHAVSPQPRGLHHTRGGGTMYRHGTPSPDHLVHATVLRAFMSHEREAAYPETQGPL